MWLPIINNQENKMKKMFIVAVTALVIGLTGCTKNSTDYSVEENREIWTKVDGPVIVSKELGNGGILLESANEFFIISIDFDVEIGEKVNVFVQGECINVEPIEDEYPLVDDYDYDATMASYSYQEEVN